MSHLSPEESFLKGANDWICESYSLVTRYVAHKVNTETKLLHGVIFATPLLSDGLTEFEIDNEHFSAGLEIQANLSRVQIFERISSAINGDLIFNDNTIKLDSKYKKDIQPGQIEIDPWYSELHIKNIGNHPSQTAYAENRQEQDTSLRGCTPPFDGIEDLCGWLHLVDPRRENTPTSIEISIKPPIDILFGESYLSKDKFFLKLVAHSKFDISRINLAIRELPSVDLKTRNNVTSSISWEDESENVKIGILEKNSINTESLLTMLSLGNRTIRRQWFLDPEKSQNLRYLATNHFDKELRQLRHHLIDVTDSRKFEQAIASLANLLGFTSAIQVETEAPDVIAISPRGRILIIECTTKISDFSTKVGKLVDRRISLQNHLAASGKHAEVVAILACAQSASQIAIEPESLKKHGIALVTKETIQSAFERARHLEDPDNLVDQLLQNLNSKSA